MTFKPLLLIVDDETVVLQALMRVLHRDFEVFTAANTVDAHNLLKQHPFHVVLCDQNLKDGQGLQICQYLQQHYPQAVRVLLSGQHQTEEISNALNSQLIHRFFLKPWDNTLLRLQLLECAQLALLLAKNKDLEEASLTDAVTGLRNRRDFDERLRSEIDRCNRHSRHLSLILLDIDDYKQINDQQGHPVGDQVLQSISKVLSQSTRNIDNVSRVGGDEFAVILPDTKLQDAFEVAERIRRAIVAIDVTGPKGRVKISASLGLAAFPEHGKDFQSLLEKTDNALLDAKKQGRNKTVIAPI